MRIFHYNNALSQEDSIRIGEYLKKKWISFQEAIYHHIGELGLSKSGLETISNVKKRIDSLCSKTNLDVSDLILEVYDQSGLSRQFSHIDTKHSREALLNLRQLHELSSNFEEFHGKDLSLFIDYLEILDEMDGNPPPARIADEDAINLMTIHAAKGLEFSVVFLTNLAKEHLFLTLAVKYADDEREPSEFLQDIGYENWRDKGNITFGDLSYFRDTDTKVREMIKDSVLEREKALRKRLLTESLDSGDFKELIDSNWQKIG